jgi:hypothetical protein
MIYNLLLTKNNKDSCSHKKFLIKAWKINLLTTNIL